MQDTFVYIRKIGDTAGTTRKQVGKWALTDKNSIPQGYELDPDYQGNYQPTADPANEVKKRLKKEAVVVVSPPKQEEPIETEEVIELVSPLDEEISEPENIEDESLEAEETQETEVLVKPKKKAGRPKKK